MTRLCFKCDKEIEMGDGRIQAVDMPYINLWFHKSCFREVSNMAEYLMQNSSKVLEFSKKNARNYG